MMLVTSGSVLLLTCLGFSTYEFITFRQSTIRHLSTIAKVISSNSTAVLAFEDAKGAQEILSAIKAEPHISVAALYNVDGKLFSSYPVGLPKRDFPISPEVDGYRFGPDYLIGLEPVVKGEKRLGTLYVKSDMKARTERLKLYGILAISMTTLASALSYFLSRMLQGQISKPILALVETAEKVSKYADYSVRARKLGTEELGMLTESFNQMLFRIQEQMARLDLLNRITRAIGERLDLPSIFQVITGNLEDKLPVDFICICLYDETSEQLSVSSVGIKSGPVATKMGLGERARFPVDQNGLGRCVQGQLVYEPDISLVDFPFARLLVEQGMRSLVLSPLIVESTVFGVMVTARRDPESFSSMECEFLRQLSEHAALAAHQANLYSALQQAYDDLRFSQQTILQQERLRALGQMASGIAHDINNAISPVTLYSEFLLEKEPDLSPRAREYLQIISRASEDVASTVARLREFYRQRESKMNLLPMQLNLILDQVIELTRARWHDIPQERGVVIEIETDFSPSLPPIMGVESEIREALTNLFFNAFDAMPNGGTLTLRTRLAGEDQVRLEISDTGIGMDEDTRKRCLEPFYTTKGQRGTGLGLAMVYGIAQRHSADLEIDSAVGIGTTVRLLFQVSDTIGSVPAGEVFPKPFPLKLLVVDDDPLLLKSLFDILTGDGHSVVIANSGKLGVEAFLAAREEASPFDVVLTDLGMPYMDGRKVAAAIRAASSSTPVILLTGWGQRMLAEGDIPPYVFRVLSKPPKLADLREALTQAINPA